jgi:tetratricopeptide (TPR) repeat protein
MPHPSALARICLLVVWVGCAETPHQADGPEANAAAADVQHFLALARSAHWTFPTSSGKPIPEPLPPWAEQLVRERASLTQVLQGSIQQGQHKQALELAAETWRTWVLAQDEVGGRAVLRVVLSAPADPTTARARALVAYGDALLAFRLGDIAASGVRSREALDAARVAKDPEAEGFALLAQSRVALSQRKSIEARDFALGARAKLRARGAAYDQAPLHMLAQAQRAARALDEAASLFGESLTLNRQLGDLGMVAIELQNLAYVELRRGHLDAAEKTFAEAEKLAGDANPYDQVIRRMNRAALAQAKGDTATARARIQEARDILSREKIALSADDEAELREVEQRLR